jgi:hypothetical protein
LVVSPKVEATGEVFDRDGVLVIERITVRYRLTVREDQPTEAERVHGVDALDDDERRVARQA